MGEPWPPCPHPLPALADERVRPWWPTAGPCPRFATPCLGASTGFLAGRLRAAGRGGVGPAALGISAGARGVPGRAVAGCVECAHAAPTGLHLDLTRFAAGGLEFRGPWGVSYVANLTPDPTPGWGAGKMGGGHAAPYSGPAERRACVAPHAHPAPTRRRDRRGGPPGPDHLPPVAAAHPPPGAHLRAPELIPAVGARPVRPRPARPDRAAGLTRATGVKIVIRA